MFTGAPDRRLFEGPLSPGPRFEHPERRLRHVRLVVQQPVFAKSALKGTGKRSSIRGSGLAPLLEGPQQDRLADGTDRDRPRRGWRDGRLEMQFRKLLGARRFERVGAGEREVEHYPEAVQVRPGI